MALRTAVYGLGAALAAACGVFVALEGETGIAAACAFFAAICAGLAAIVWGRHRGGVLGLTVDGLTCTCWSEPLPFSELGGVTFQERAMFATLTERTRERAKWELLPVRRGRQYVPTDLMDAPEAVVDHIVRYARRDVG